MFEIDTVWQGRVTMQIKKSSMIGIFKSETSYRDYKITIELK